MTKRSRGKRLGRRQLVVAAAITSIITTACSGGGSDTAEGPPETTVRSVAPTSSTTTTVPTTIETTTTTAPPVPEIWVDPINGDPAASGQPGFPIRSAQDAIERAEPGDTIFLGEGVHAPIALVGVSGREDAPITIAGAPGATAVLSDGDYNRRASIHMEDSAWIVVEDVTLRTSLWAVDTYRSENLLFDGLTVDDIGQEALHFRENSAYVTVRNSSISGTGQRPDYDLGGSGVYLGTSRGDDQTHDILIENNEIFNTASEGIDVKAATYNIIIRNNRIHDISTLQSGAVVLHLGERPPLFDPNILVEGNDIWNIQSNTQWADGNAIVIDAAATVRNNRLWNTQHRGILVEGQFLDGQPTGISISGNVIFNSGRHDVEIKGDQAVVAFDGNYSADPVGVGFESINNRPATQEDFDTWSPVP